MLFEKRIKEIFRRRVYTRADDVGAVVYLGPEDFPGLTVTPYSFPAAEGHRLFGYFYDFGDPIPGRVVIFDHGMGGGHRSYMQEIVMLARRGFRVFAYDHTGCMTSEGETTGGFGQSLSDLDAALTALRADPALAGVKFAVVGHSWGAFATLNIPALHPEVTHIVAMAGFRSVEAIVRSTFRGLLAPYRRAILAVEAESHPEMMRYDAVTSLCHTDAKVLLLHSEDDPTVPAHHHFDAMERALSWRENIRFLRLTGRGHNPNYTEDAAAYLGGFLKALGERVKAGGLRDTEGHRAFLAGYDFFRMTAQDEAVWEEIYKTLEA